MRIARRPKCPISAYNASPPVRAKNTEPGKSDPAVGAREIGERVTRIERNQYSGPSEDMRDPGEPEHHEPGGHHRSEKSADAAAASALDHKKCDQHHTATGRTYGLNTGVAICNPSIALRTEIAGVIMASPKNSEAPPSPIASRTVRNRPAAGRASEINAIVPPSP